MLEPDDGSGAEPRREGKRPGPTEPGPLRVLARGARARCPRCAAGALFDGWFHIRERCPRCRLRLEREEGGFLGAMTVNYSVTTLSWLILLGVWLAVDLPDVHVLALTVTSLLLVGAAPLLFYRPSKTTWAALDYLVYRSAPDYRSQDAADRASGNGGRY